MPAFFFVFTAGSVFVLVHERWWSFLVPLAAVVVQIVLVDREGDK
jgi:hypothetical protein